MWNVKIIRHILKILTATFDTLVDSNLGVAKSADTECPNIGCSVDACHFTDFITVHVAAQILKCCRLEENILGNSNTKPSPEFC